MASDTQSVHYELDDGVATLRIDDGKRNALSPQVLGEINAALDRAEADRASVIITGREGVFSAGFDLHVMKRGGMNALRMLKAGYALPARVMTYPYPVVAACNGHSFAMGVFLMLSTDYVIGTEGNFRIAANEVAIGLPMPRVAATVLQHRLNPAAFQRAVMLAENFAVESAQNAGFFDEVVAPAELQARAEACIRQFGNLNIAAHTATKRRVRAAVVRKIRKSIPLDLINAAMMGVRGAGPG